MRSMGQFQGSLSLPGFVLKPVEKSGVEFSTWHHMGAPKVLLVVGRFGFQILGYGISAWSLFTVNPNNLVCSLAASPLTALPPLLASK